MRAKLGFSQSVLRREDDPLLRGGGRYIGDVVPRETLHAIVVRSPHANARFHIDAAKPWAAPGVRKWLGEEAAGANRLAAESCAIF
jgi:carbon-monoxide dehydrogenase large subunit